MRPKSAERPGAGQGAMAYSASVVSQPLPEIAFRDFDPPARGGLVLFRYGVRGGACSGFSPFSGVMRSEVMRLRVLRST